MEAKARLSNYRVSARKARLVADEIRGKGVEDALTILDLSPKRFAKPLAKLVRSALAKNAVSLIIAHNHVSGNPKPSKEDINLTELLQASCDLVGISVLDHIIIGGDQHFSFAMKGLIKKR